MLYEYDVDDPQTQCAVKRRAEKAVVREKMARNAAAEKRTGGGECEREEFDDIEQLYAERVSRYNGIWAGLSPITHCLTQRCCSP